MTRIILALALLLAFAGADIKPGFAQNRRMIVIRDAEIEHIITQFAAPLLRAAGLNPNAVQIHLIKDNSLNSFVVGGQQIFINTGLIMRAETPSQLIGVIAHEIGHIAGGHLVRLQDAVGELNSTSILAVILGAAAIAAGQGQLGSAIVAGGQHVAERNFLQFTRTQESAADQAALTFLERAHRSGKGLLEFLQILGDQEALLSSNQDPYVRTHPISRERIAMLRDRVNRSKYGNKPDDPADIAAFERVKAKLYAFLKDPEKTLRRYPADSGSVTARYARAIAYYRVPDLDKAFAILDSLIGEFPDNAFFHELRGQILFENGKAKEAVASYRKAAELSPASSLIWLALGQAELATGDTTRLPDAIAHLEKASRLEPRNPSTWRQLAIGYSRDDRQGEAALASAEAAINRNRPADARMFTKRALKLLPTGSPGWLRAQDIDGAAARSKAK